MFDKYQGKLHCFSPPVMLATFLIEFTLAFYVLWRYKASLISRLAFITLLALGLFQLSEYMLCGGLGLSNIEWARIGYGSITLLPALGIHMIVALAGKKRPFLIKTAYATCATFLGIYLATDNSIHLEACYANYTVFSSYRMITVPFAFYYYGWLLIGIYLAWSWAKELPKKRKALHSMIIGYLVFLLPTTTLNILDPSTTKAIPSIMCGFAVLFAFILVIKVLPFSCKVRSSSYNLFKNFLSRI